MTRIRLKNIDRFVDRHGKTRCYYRAGKGDRVVLPGLPGSPEFMLAYEKAARGEPIRRQPAQRGPAGTFDRLIQDYFSSPEFKTLRASTQRAYTRVIERLIRDEKIGHRLVKEMGREHVKLIVSKRAATPGAANDVLKKLKILIHFAIDNGWRTDDPTLRIKKFGQGEFHTWSNDEIAMFEAFWPIGTPERVAFALLLYTGQRRSDVVRMSWDDVDDGAIQVAQLKTGAKLWVAIHDDLACILASAPRRADTILATAFGRPFTSNGFGNFMADKIAAAGLPDRCVTHGLRKAAARRLAEAGCTTNEIAAITGHATLQEVERYTKAAEQRRLAKTAIDRLSGSSTRPGAQFPNLREGFGKSFENTFKIQQEDEFWRTRQDSNL